MAGELKPIKEAPDEIRKIITKIIEHEKQNMNKRQGIKDDIVDIIKKEIQ
jgi:dissimilatory sulfite reductase (desulfoviridin) alpha/beta subunit